MFFIEINQHFGEQTKYLLLFILTIGIAWVVLFFYSYKRYGSKRTLIYFLPMFIAALIIESAGVACGRYSYPGYLLYLSVGGGGVPPIILLGWTVNLFLFYGLAKYVVARMYQKRNHLQILLISFAAGLFAVCLDLLEDPLAHYNNWWIWEGTLTGVKFYDVPLLNFVGWFFLIFFMTLATLLIERSHFSENRKVLLSVSSLSITGTIIFIMQGLFSMIFRTLGLS